MADFTYILNDPTTPNLVLGVDLPTQMPASQFAVNGYRGATPTMYTPEHQAACCYYSMVNCLALANKYLLNPITKWAAIPVLFIEPRAGKQLNAYYDRQAVRFFYAPDPVSKTIVYAANSSDVRNHEYGHAILDAVRPDLFNLPAVEVWAFHEAFGDINAILNLLQYDMVQDLLLQETGGNLTISNTVTKLAEEMGNAIFNITGGRMGHTAGMLRNAVNQFKYIEPEKLPPNGLDNQIVSEPHSFSRIFTGAWWDILAGVYDVEAKTKSPKEALIATVDTMATYTFRCLTIAPATVRFYDAVAKAMLVVDKANDYKYNELMNRVFMDRQILRAAYRPMVAMNWEMLKPYMAEGDQVLESKNVSVWRSSNIITLNLPQHMMNVEMPSDTYYECNGTGDCVEWLSTSADELISHADFCVDFLKKNDMIRADKQTPFELDSDGNLKRSHFACQCVANNAFDPQAPEFGKPWKIQNNSGCGCSCRSAECLRTACNETLTTVSDSSSETIEKSKKLRF